MSKITLSVSMITKNAASSLSRTLESISDLADEIVIIDAFSTDQTLEIAKKYKATLYQNKYLGEGPQRNYGLQKVNGDWILVLDADEVVTEELRKEIKEKINQKYDENGYIIPIQSFFCGKPINHGGEYYSKMILFRRQFGYSTDNEIHAFYRIREGKVGKLTNKLNHYSYEGMFRTLSKFTNYAKRLARQKAEKGERFSIIKLLTYPPHMFWARFIIDQGYKDGFFRLPLDFGFAYMEFFTYLYLFFS
jgi:glycosyltransferase involved in cell wall biosynthesis